MATYAHPEVLVSTDWVLAHHKDENVRIIEVDTDTTAYDQGHIPGAIGWNWYTQLSDQLTRDIIGQADMGKLLSESGIKPDTTIILYGDNNNWFAAWAFWQLKIYQHADVRLMNGGRKKWLALDLPLSTEAPTYAGTHYEAPAPDMSIRAYLQDVMATLGKNDTALIDVRSADEFTGKILAPPGLPETCQRGGHIPGAKNIGWATAANEDGTFKGFEELKDLYASHGINGDSQIIAYCRIGERSSYSWFVAKYLLGYENARNYDGSWTEWGNLVAAPIEK
ncbi:MAG: sulfurtransferase [Bacteroidota bacterium]